MPFLSKSPLVKATLESSALSAISNMAAQSIEIYQGRRFGYSFVEFFHFLTIALITGPPNYYWQHWLERTFPTYRSRAHIPSASTLAMTSHKRTDSIVKHTSQSSSSTPFSSIATGTGTTIPPPANGAFASNHNQHNHNTGNHQPGLGLGLAISASALASGSGARSGGGGVLEVATAAIAAATTSGTDKSISGGEGIEMVQFSSGLTMVAGGTSSSDGPAPRKSGSFSPRPSSYNLASAYSPSPPTATGPSISSITGTSLLSSSPPSMSLDIRHVIFKFLLDALFLGALFNTVLFLFLSGLLKGHYVSAIWLIIRKDTIPIIITGFRIWPIATVINFTLVPVRKRIVFLSLVSLVWGMYLSLVSSEV